VATFISLYIRFSLDTFSGSAVGMSGHRRGRLSPEVGAVVQRAFEAAGEQLYHESHDQESATTAHRPSAGRW